MARKTHIQPTAVSISNLRIKYGQKLLFDNFALQLATNKWTCLLGPSGIGKTSLLRFIAGLLDGKESECSGTVITTNFADTPSSSLPLRHPHEALLRGASAKVTSLSQRHPSYSSDPDLVPANAGNQCQKNSSKRSIVTSGSSGQARGQVLGPSCSWDDASVEELTHHATKPRVDDVSKRNDRDVLNNKITYMTQQDSLLPWLNVLDNVLIGFALRNEQITDALKNQAEVLLEKAQLIGISQLKPHQLSHGMRQRVALVRSLMENRQIILMDEPFSALDMVTKLKLQDLAKDLLKDRTVLLVTHDPLEALKLGDYVYILKGSPAKIHHVIAPQKNAKGAALFEQQEALLRLITEEEAVE